MFSFSRFVWHYCQASSIANDPAPHLMKGTGWGGIVQYLVFYIAAHISLSNPWLKPLYICYLLCLYYCMRSLKQFWTEVLCFTVVCILKQSLTFLCYSEHILKQSSTDISMLHLLFTLFYTILNTSSSNLWQSHYATLIIHFVSHCCMHPQAILDWSWHALCVIHIILHNFKQILKQSLTEAQVLHTCRSPSSHWQSAEVIFNTYCQHWKTEISNVKRLGQDESGLMLTLSGNRKLLYRWVVPK